MDSRLVRAPKVIARTLFGPLAVMYTHWQDKRHPVFCAEIAHPMSYPPVESLMSDIPALRHLAGLVKRAVALLRSPLILFLVVWATLIGFVVWGQVPQAPVWLGGAIIVASGLYLLHRETRTTRLRRRRESEVIEAAPPPAAAPAPAFLALEGEDEEASGPR